MGVVLDEKTRRKIEDGKILVFNLMAESAAFHEDNEEGACECFITMSNSKGDKIAELYRYFLVKKYNDKHYKNFINRFCSDQTYREQFNRKHDEKKDNGDDVDERLRELVARFNDAGLTTKYSCQGTDDAWKDRPGKTDGHSETAYISFEMGLPRSFCELISPDKRLSMFASSIRATNRKYNRIFPDIVNQILGEWSKIQEGV